GLFGSAAQEAAWVADGVRRAHLHDGVPWSQMAVLSRSARRTLPTLRRALLAAGVPIAAPPDELPTGRQPAVLPLLMVLRYAARPDEIDADAATALLASPLGSADPMRMRRLRAVAGAAIRDGESAEQVLWWIWQAAGLEQRWTAASALGGPIGAAADRDLDAVLALFDAAARHADRLPGAGVAAFVEYLAD